MKGLVELINENCRPFISEDIKSIDPSKVIVINEVGKIKQISIPSHSGNCDDPDSDFSGIRLIPLVIIPRKTPNCCIVEILLKKHPEWGWVLPSIKEPFFPIRIFRKCKRLCDARIFIGF